MPRYLLYTLMFLCGTAACTYTTEYKPAGVDSIKHTYYKVDTSVFAVLPLDSVAWLINDGKPDILTGEDLEGIEKILNSSVDRYNKNDTTREYTGHIDLAKYKRQYVPYISKDGHLMVWVNCFCFEEPFTGNSWKKHIVHVDDGGSCFFQVTIDLATGQYSGFSTNGMG